MMTQHSSEDFVIHVKGEILLQLFNKIKLRNWTKAFLETKFVSILSQNFRNQGLVPL